MSLTAQALRDIGAAHDWYSKQAPGQGACRAWGAKAKNGHADAMWRRFCSPIAVAMGQKAAAAGRRRAILQPAILKSDRLPGEEFLAAAGLQIERLPQAPQLYAEVLPRVRRCLLPRFPYGLFFTLRGDDIRVLAVLHQARDHHSWPVGRKGSGQ
ncbi:MAG: type II toxin-antitoxin system RelE/ParE family toxin [Pseudomonadota bacterium]